MSNDTRAEPASDDITVQVNGVESRITEGGRVLDAIHSAGFNVPTLCYDERLGPQGTCRTCLVEVEVPSTNGEPRTRQTVASCTWFASEGQRVPTHNDSLRDYRRTLLELVLSETPPPTECPKCASFGTCEFHAAVIEYEAEWDTFPNLTTRPKADDPNPFIQRDYDFCIACYRCTNICNDWEQASAITVTGRAQTSKIYTFFDNLLLKSPCTFCGQCINTCPTGALTDRKIVGRTQAAKVDRTKTICPYCGVGCGIELLTQDGNLMGAQPDFASPSRGSLCVKGQFGAWDFVKSEERLKFPLIRRNGNLEQATWDEALTLVSTRFQEIKNEDGPDSIVCWASARVVTEANYLMQKFARVAIGTNNIDNCSRT